MYENYDYDYEVETNEDENLTVWKALKAFIQGVWEGMKTAFLVTGILACVGYWIGHPEWFFKKRFCDMIIKNCSK